MVLGFQLFVLSVTKVSRMDVMVIYNTSSTDDGWGNARKHENSPFLSKNRDEKVGKIFNKVAKKCTWVNFVIMDFQILIDMIWF